MMDSGDVSDMQEIGCCIKGVTFPVSMVQNYVTAEGRSDGVTVERARPDDVIAP